jgi:hypothetical protein
MDLSSDHVASALTGVAGGAGSIGLVAKYIIQHWIKNHDKRADKMGDGMQAVAVELAKVGVKLEALEKVVERVGRRGEDVAVLKSEMKVVRENLNGLGAKFRSLNRP